mgnify:CR=1 FL=1
MNTKQGGQDLKPVTENYFEVTDNSEFDEQMRECAEKKIPYVLISEMGTFLTGYDEQLNFDLDYLTTKVTDDLFVTQQERFYQAMLLNVVNGI